MEHCKDMITDIKPEIDISDKQVRNAIIYSVALNQLSIAQILNAEANLLCRGIRQARCNDELIKLNKAVYEKLEVLTEFESLLVEKLQLILCFDWQNKCNQEN